MMQLWNSLLEALENGKQSLSIYTQQNADDQPVLDSTDNVQPLTPEDDDAATQATELLSKFQKLKYVPNENEHGGKYMTIQNGVIYTIIPNNFPEDELYQLYQNLKQAGKVE